MQLTLIRKNTIDMSILPEKISGKYWITQKNKNDAKIIAVEGMSGNWCLVSNREVSVLDNENNSLDKVILEPNRCYKIILSQNNEIALILTETNDKSRYVFKKYAVKDNAKVTIGRDAQCSIRYKNSFITSIHAVLTVSNGNMIIEDNSSSNGTYINGSRIERKRVVPGDIIYLMGLRIIIGKDMIAINNPDNLITLDLDIFSEYKPERLKVRGKEKETTLEKAANDNLFFRSPRLKKGIQTAQFKIDAPPALENQEETPMLLMIGPSMTMGMSSMFMAVFALQNVISTGASIITALPTMVMAVAMMTGMVLWPILMKKYERRKRIEREAKRKKKYSEYLSEMYQKIMKECYFQTELLHINNVEYSKCSKFVMETQRNLWERSPSHDDFLELRLGLSDLTLDAKIVAPEWKFTLNDDYLQDKMFELVNAPKILNNVPVTISLTKDHIVGIIGDRDKSINIAKHIILRTMALHSYDELKMVFIYNKSEETILNFSKWLPHAWNATRDIRFIATNETSAREISSYLETELSLREKASTDDIEKMTHYVIFCFDKRLADKVDFIKQSLTMKSYLGFSFINLYDEIKKLPKECAQIIDIGDKTARLYNRNDISGEYIKFEPDIIKGIDIEALAIKLSNTKLNTLERDFALPEMLTFLDLFKVGKVEHLNTITRWQENDPTKSLFAPIGIDEFGNISGLDIHEKFHGPHGLIAGMTGSGKSEYIMTYILSLAINYHPYEVAFILIDYKGGGMADAFADLPHLAGTITNLDGAAVNRSLVSIQSELKRRQAIFSQVGNRLEMSNIDIYKYQKLYRDGLVKEPLQHLVIISDEFAELKMQQPDFMQQLVSAARIGRSLGIHLVLATQKPSGVVDDQIWSNARFRVCLKVQEKSDSMDMIKRPEAAQLSKAGRYYLQVGYNELFMLGQSAWSGASYYPSEEIEEKIDDSVIVIDETGREIKSARLNKRVSNQSNEDSQINSIIKYLKSLAQDEKVSVRKLWLEPLKDIIVLENLQSKYSYEYDSYIIEPIIGEFDDPTNQRQSYCTLPITKGGNIVIYGSQGSGKTTLLSTIIYQLIKNYTPNKINIYILDFGAETLRAFEDAPTVGDVVLAGEEEKIVNLFKRLKLEIAKRKKILAQFGGEFSAYVSSGGDLSTILTIINNYAAFSEIYEELEDEFSYLTREGAKYGIIFMMTATSINAVRYRIQANFKQNIPLQLNEKSEYVAVLGEVNNTYPAAKPGRGLIKLEKVYEFQSAVACDDLATMYTNFRECCKDISETWNGKEAGQIPVLPDELHVNYFTNVINSSAPGILPIGINVENHETVFYNFNNKYVNIILSKDNSGSLIAKAIADIYSLQEIKTTYIDYNSKVTNDTSYQTIITLKDIKKEFKKLIRFLVDRHRKKNKENVEDFSPVVYVINNLSGTLLLLENKERSDIADMLLNGNDLGVSIVLSESIDAVSNIQHEKWFVKNSSSKDGIWVGSGISSQRSLTVSNINSDMYSDIAEGMGYILENGRAHLLKLVTPVKMKEGK